MTKITPKRRTMLTASARAAYDPSASGILNPLASSMSASAESWARRTKCRAEGDTRITDLRAGWARRPVRCPRAASLTHCRRKPRCVCHSTYRRRSSRYRCSRRWRRRSRHSGPSARIARSWTAQNGCSRCSQSGRNPGLKRDPHHSLQFDRRNETGRQHDPGRRGRREGGRGRRREDHQGVPWEEAQGVPWEEVQGAPWEGEEEKMRAQHLARSWQPRARRSPTVPKESSATSCISFGLDASFAELVSR